MDLDTVLNRPWSGWSKDDGPDTDVVLSSRIRLARNLEGVPFPVAMKGEHLTAVMAAAERVVESLNSGAGLGRYSLIAIKDLRQLDRAVLVEKHLMSPQHASNEKYGALILREDECVSIMVNEEDHFRIQTLSSGLQLPETLRLANVVDDAMDRVVRYAFSPQIGYLTCCPTNVGTGLRGSVMVHVPALALTGQAGSVLSAVGKLGLVVRGLYGEGSEAAGNVFQISNQVSLGQTEGDIVANLSGIARRIIDQERDARARLINGIRMQLEDRVFRAFGVMKNARIMSSAEALRLWSDIRLGICAGLIMGIPLAKLDELLVMSRPGYIQRTAGREMEPSERDITRANMIRKLLEV
ncbi:MAG TPA: protein arginine kinase [Firmicutes bacterium]|nr:protein arginine kinase [Bacillota bacterium]